MADAFGDDAGFARTGARNHQQGSFAMTYGGALCGIEFLAEFGRWRS
jgi:hypothetical protein